MSDRGRLPGCHMFRNENAVCEHGFSLYAYGHDVVYVHLRLRAASRMVCRLSSSATS